MQKLETELNKQAQILGDLNMELNKYTQNNETLSLQIAKLQERINKKKKLVEQESKDKSIIHEKLIKAELLKEELEIQSVRMGEDENSIETVVVEEIKRPEFLNKPVKDQTKSEKQENSDTFYNNESKGDYQPPALFLDVDHESQDSDQEEDSDVLESVRQKLQNLGEEEDEQEEQKQDEQSGKKGEDR